jgi:succinoglycan biosynthesis transport protein ExoP
MWSKRTKVCFSYGAEDRIMSIFQFLRAFWARKYLIACTTLAAFIGALVVVSVLPPRWQAHSRVLLGELKPDPITGLVPPSATARSYIATQLELVTDYSVAGQVAEQLGWLSDPNLIQQYQRGAKPDSPDFRHWLAQLVIARTKATVLQDSNIMEITYTGTSPDNAKAVADALRTAYIDQSLTFHRDDALKTAAFFDSEVTKAKAALDAAETAESDYERQNGIVMQDDKTDVDTARLRALSMEGVAPASAAAAMQVGSSPTALELAGVDAQLAQAEKNLGPNHPELLALKSRRAALAAVAAKEEANARSAGGAVGGGSGALDRLVQAQKSRVIAQSGKLARLQQLEAEVDLSRDQLNKASAHVADLRQEAAIDDTGITPLGGAVTPQAPSFPNKLLILPGATVAGLGIGLLVALLMELLSRRVRGPEDLQYIGGLPLIAVVAASENAGGGWFGRRKSALARGSTSGSAPKVARA